MKLWECLPAVSLCGPKPEVATSILPRGMARMRHSRLFNAAQREERLAKCRELLAMAKRECSVISRTVTKGESGLIEECNEPDEELEVPKASPCQCRGCGAETELVGRFRGNESMLIVNIAQQIVPQLATLLLIINEATVNELLAHARVLDNVAFSTSIDCRPAARSAVHIA